MINFKIIRSTLMRWLGASLLFSITACDQEPTYDGPVGDLTSKVELVTFSDGFSNDSMDHSGIEVVFDGGGYSRTTSTNESGEYAVAGLRSGTYNIILNKEGYNENRMVGYQFVGGEVTTELYTNFIFEKLDADISLDVLEQDSNSFTRIGFEGKATVSYPESYSRRPMFYCYLHNEPDVSYKNYTDVSPMDFYRYGSDEEDKYDFLLSIDTAQFPIGSELHMIVYPTSSYSGGYKDINTGMIVHPGVNPDAGSNVMSVEVPELPASP